MEEKEKGNEEEEAITKAALTLEGPEVQFSPIDKCYIGLVKLIGDLQDRMMKTFEVLAKQMSKVESRLTDALIEQIKFLKGVDTRIREVEKVHNEWRSRRRRRGRKDE